MKRWYVHRKFDERIAVLTAQNRRETKANRYTTKAAVGSIYRNAVRLLLMKAKGEERWRIFYSMSERSLRVFATAMAVAGKACRAS